MKKILIAIIFTGISFTSYSSTHYIYLNEDDCNLCTAALHKLKALYAQYNFQDYKIMVKKELRRDSIFLVERFDLNSSDLRKLIWTDSFAVKNSPNSILHIPEENFKIKLKNFNPESVRPYIVKSTKEVEVKAVKYKALCELTSLLPTRVKFHSSTPGFLCIENQYNSDFYFYNIQTEKIDTFLLSDKLEKRLYREGFGILGDNIYNNYKKSKYSTLAKNKIKSYYYDEKLQIHYFLVSIFYPYYTNGKLTNINKKIFLIKADLNLLIRRVQDVPIDLNKGLFENTFAIYGSKFYSVAKDATKTKFLNSYLIQPDSLLDEGFKKFSLPWIYQRYNLGYNFVNFICSQNLLTFPLGDYYIDLKTMKKNSLNWSQSTLESDSTIMQFDKNHHIPFAIWSISKNSALDFFISCTRNDKIEIVKFRTNGLNSEVRWSDDFTADYSSMPVFYRKRDNSTGAVLVEKGKCIELISGF